MIVPVVDADTSLARYTAWAAGEREVGLHDESGL